ncbi:MAG: DUF1223 domain-containing protein [Thermoanaerobaculia bacterium]
MQTLLRDLAESLRPRVLPGVAALSLALVVTASPAALAGQGRPTHPVVVELFTSQGCSSCPPADRLLSNLADHYGEEVVALAFHVDSWNFSGWTDPFSSREWTFRQGAYNRVLGEPPYTPQLVVAGRTAMVASEIETLKSSLAEAWAGPAADLELTLRPSPEEVGIDVEVDIPEALRDGRMELLVAVYEKDLVTEVADGENGGKTLHDNYVVRSLERIARWKAGEPARSRHTARIRLDPAWERPNLGVAVLLQDPRTLEIHGAARMPLAATTPAGAESPAAGR